MIYYLGKGSREQRKLTARVASRSKKKLVAHAEWSGNARIAIADTGGRKQKSRGSGSAGVEILRDVRRPTRRLRFMGWGRGRPSLTKTNGKALIKGTAALLSISVLAFLCRSGLIVVEAVIVLISLTAMGFWKVPYSRFRDGAWAHIFGHMKDCHLWMGSKTRKALQHVQAAVQAALFLGLFDLTNPFGVRIKMQTPEFLEQDHNTFWKTALDILIVPCKDRIPVHEGT